MREDKGKESEAPRIHRWLVVWECSKCGSKLTGYYASHEFLPPQACHSTMGPKLRDDQRGKGLIRRNLPRGEICGEIMSVILDERANWRGCDRDRKPDQAAD